MESITRLLNKFDVSYHELKLKLNLVKLKRFEINQMEITPISYTYDKFIYSGKYFYFIKELIPYKYHYLVEIEKPLAIITNSKIKAFVSNIPIFFVEKPINEKKLTFEIKEKILQKKFRIYFFNFGYGYRFINIFTPILEKRNINIFSEILKKLKTINYPRGYRVRFIFLEENNKTFIEKIYKEYFKDAHFNVLIDETGFGFEKLIYKTNAYIHLNKEMLNIINKHLNVHYKTENIFENLKIPNLIWFKSIEKNPYIDTSQDVAKNIFGCINFLAKELE
ncbi:MAG TPA: hypothetical protein EYH43_01005 [Persephonella sp.]|nr:hypothetical protein [Hydrogenothermaceae bacterium]HIQ24546.1 hypothetical protein [Persephonella sp.]